MYDPRIGASEILALQALSDSIRFQWVELHGDRAGYDDPALVCGLGKMEGMSFMFMGHQKGRNTKENIYRNFAMPTPNGYTFLPSISLPTILCSLYSIYYGDSQIGLLDAHVSSLRVLRGDRQIGLRDAHVSILCVLRG